MFQNLGDGAYFHSGSLAIRAAVATGTTSTFKILFNDAVAMTGGQPLDGTLPPQAISWQVRAEGVQRIAVVADDLGRYAGQPPFAEGVTLHPREDLDAVQRELRDVKGVSVLIYDQMCAAEKRRRRNRGKLADPDWRVIINPLVCEGCGDCSVKSNCLSVAPVETEFGRKRAIDQSSCNKDFSCLQGFCPSFVVVEGAPSSVEPPPEPLRPDLLAEGWNVLITGVGGTGVVTIGAILAMAAHLERRGATTLDMTGLAQKGGPVSTHLRLLARPGEPRALKIGAQTADLLIGGEVDRHRLEAMRTPHLFGPAHPGFRVVSREERDQGATLTYRIMPERLAAWFRPRPSTHPTSPGASPQLWQTRRAPR